MNPHHSSLNPNLLRSRFAKGFLRCLIRIKRESSKKIPSTPREMFKRCDKVKTAADKSLASAVGSRRAWTRALLFKIRNRSRRQLWRRRPLIKRVNNKNRRYFKKEKISTDEEGDGFDEAKKLRKVVPGGEAMDLCSLLDETAHYVMCLSTQVQVMRCIADFYSN